MGNLNDLPRMTTVARRKRAMVVPLERFSSVDRRGVLRGLFTLEGLVLLWWTSGSLSNQRLTYGAQMWLIRSGQRS